MEDTQLTKLQQFFKNNKYLQLEDTDNKGRCVIAKQDIPECTTIIHEEPLYYFDSSKHPPCVLTCKTCLKFYNKLTAEQKAQNEIIQQQIIEYEQKQQEKLQSKADDECSVSDFSSDSEQEDYQQINNQEQQNEQKAKNKKQKRTVLKKPQLIYSDAINELQTQFQGHLGYVHLMAEILLSNPENQDNDSDSCIENTDKNQDKNDNKNDKINENNENYQNKSNNTTSQNFKEFSQLDFCPSNPSKNQNLAATINFLKNFFLSQNESFNLQKQQIFEKLVSNSHGQTDPPENGLFICTSMLNHSCKNNCFYFLEKQKITVRNFKKINKGEEVTVSYIRNLYQPRILRQKELAYRGFKCVCERCLDTEKEEVRIWGCPKKQSNNCTGFFMPFNNSSVFKCDQCGNQENFLSKAKKSEKNIDMELLHKKHFKIHQDMDNNLKEAGFSMPEELFEALALQLIDNYKWLFQTNFYPENISLYDVIAQRFNKAKNKKKTQFYFEKAFQEAIACFGERSQQAQLQLSRLKNPPQQCQIF
ncbi:hypothetical protein PPERSA_08617 [Pseudocohnilembus persalinus]|uniref:SET domain-containing protein n=1 Tax=Pseudocohnilembus persalinus TaxID=266149 RepID=A0A0V0R529_PSEPJ|nr:hypothetical protein PPERSA_08617 [Pseudocohnilembus persalinus]|eukprot:KRX09585.1 hypothetical protein PPERSA_08617 [Pseudocohnilembus persalinus]